VIDQIPQKQKWVAPRLTVFGDVNSLTAGVPVKTVGHPSDAFFSGEHSALAVRLRRCLHDATG